MAAPAAWAQDARFRAAADFSAAHGGGALLIARSGVRLAEQQAPGAHPLGEATRVFMPILAAAMAADDRIGLNLDEPVAMTLGDWGAHPWKSQISLRALLSGVSGVAAGDARLDLPTLIALEPSAPPGERFAEDAAPYRLFAEIARRKLEARLQTREIDRYLAMRVFEPIGCGAIAFAREPDGLARLDDGATLDPETWLKLGQLLEREGLWRGRYLLHQPTLRSAMTGSFAEARRGMGFWLASAGPAQPFANSDLWTLGNGAPIDLAMVSGEDGQRLYIVPSLRLTIARLPNARADWSDAAFLARVFSAL